MHTPTINRAFGHRGLRASLLTVITASAILLAGGAALAADYQDGVSSVSAGPEVKWDWSGVNGLYGTPAFVVEKRAKRNANGQTENVNSWPGLARFLSCPPWNYNPRYKFGRIGLDLSAAPTAITEVEADWTHRTLRYAQGDSSMDLVMTRMAPAILVRLNAAKVQMFDKITDETRSGTPTKLAMAGKSGVAVYSQGQAIPAGEQTEAWMLVWAGKASPLKGLFFFYGGRQPDNIWGQPADWDAADVPWLIVLQNRPRSVTLDDKGLTFEFDSQGGDIAIMPLYGTKWLHAADTEKWAAALPADVADRARTWTARLRQFPVSVAEESSFDPAKDAVTVRQKTTFLAIKDAWNTQAKTVSYLPPTLALAFQYGLPAAFSAPPEDLDTPCLAGPLYAIGGDTVEYTLIGLAQRYLATPPAPFPPAPQARKLVAKLESQLKTMIAAGHLAPCFAVLGRDAQAILWDNPGEQLAILSRASALVGTDVRKSLKTYLDDDIRKYPPTSTILYPIDQGQRRELFAFPRDATRAPDRNFIAPRMTNLYGLWAYGHYFATPTVWTQAWESSQALLDFYTRSYDWAAFTGGRAGWDRSEMATIKGATPKDLNAAIAGLIGYGRMAVATGKTTQANQAAYLLAKAFVARYAAGKYCQYLYDSEQLTPAKDLDVPSWLRDKGNQIEMDAFLPAQQWRNDGSTDTRQPFAFSELGGYLSDVGREPTMLPLMNTVPEVAQFLRTHLAKDIARYAASAVNSYPNWYLARGELVDEIAENSYYSPYMSHPLFQTLAQVLEAPPAELERCLDIPFAAVGDLYYIDNLVSTINAYSLPASRQPTTSERAK